VITFLDRLIGEGNNRFVNHPIDRSSFSKPTIHFTKLYTSRISVKFEVLKAVRLSMLVFWVVTPCGLVGRYKRLGET
jgi:hypothetical protein